MKAKQKDLKTGWYDYRPTAGPTPLKPSHIMFVQPDGQRLFLDWDESRGALEIRSGDGQLNLSPVVGNVIVIRSVRG